MWSRFILSAPDAAGGGSPGGSGGAGSAANGGGGDGGEGGEGGEGGDGAEGAPPSRQAPPRHGANAFRTAFDQVRGELGLPKKGADGSAGRSRDTDAAGNRREAPAGQPRSSARRDDVPIREAAPAGGEGGEGGEGVDGGEGSGDELPLEPLEVLAALELEQEEHDRIAALPEVERDAEIERLAGERDELVVDFGARRDGEETIRIMAPDKATADMMRARLNEAARAARADQTIERAEHILEQSEELRYTAQADPTGFLAENVTHPADRGHVAQFLLTQPGVLDARIGETTVREWLQGVLDNPDTLASERRLVEADRINRRTAVSEDIQVMRFEDKNARGCRRAMLSSIDSLVPEDWNDEARQQLFSDAWNDLRGILRRDSLRTYDPRKMAGFVQQRLSRYGVAPRAAGGRPAPKKGPGAHQRPASQRTPADLRNTQDARRRAAGAGPGAGSPAASIPAPPKGTMLSRRKGADGKMQPSVFDWIRERLPGVRKVPS